MEKYKDYLNTLKSENTRNAANTLIKKMENYFDEDEDDGLKNIPPEFIDLFLKKECNGKSETTISNTISRLKNLFIFYGNKNAVNHLSLKYVKSITNSKQPNYFTPGEIRDIIDGLLNYQDKVLILLVYLGLYDNKFETIRHLRKDQYKDGKLYLKDKIMNLSDYSSEIIEKSIEEDEVIKYTFDLNVSDEHQTYFLRNDTPYIIKSKERKGAADIVPETTMKKRFELIAKYYNKEDITPIIVKNSRMIYDLVKLELQSNYGFDINQLELKNYMKDNHMKGTIEKINMSKKELKGKIINDIINSRDSFIQ